MGHQFLDRMIFEAKSSIYGTEEYVYRLTLQYEDASGFLRTIAEAKSFPLEVEGKTKSTKRLAEAANTIYGFLDQNFHEGDDLALFCGYLIRMVCFVRITTTEMAEALKIFETINQRGVSLNPMDLLKNMVFRELTDRSKYGEVNDVWKDMTNALEGASGDFVKHEEKPLRFLRYYLMARYDTSDVVNSVLREGDIYNWLSKHKECGYSDDPIGFVKEMRDGAYLYMRYLNVESGSASDRHIWNIAKLGGSAYKFHLLLLLSAWKMDDGTLARFKSVLESVVYYSLVNRIRTNAVEPTFAKWCSVIRMIHNEAELEQFIDSQVKPTLANWKSNNEGNFNSIGYGTMQQYRVKAILFRIAAYVDARYKNVADPKDADMSSYFGGYQVEHIMPDKHGLETPPYDLTQEEYDYNKNLIGNLTPLEQPINGSIGNGWFDSKVEEYKKTSVYLTRSIAELSDIGSNNAITRLNENLRSWDEWGPVSIQQRQSMLYKLSELIWSI